MVFTNVLLLVQQLDFFMIRSIISVWVAILLVRAVLDQIMMIVMPAIQVLYKLIRLPVIQSALPRTLI